MNKLFNLQLLELPFGAFYILVCLITGYLLLSDTVRRQEWP